jgi:tetraspanin-13/31
VLLFVYMVVLFLIFIIQFSVSCACLSVSKEDELLIASKVPEA